MLKKINRSFRGLALAGVLVLGAALTSGCHMGFDLDVDESWLPGWSDLEVTWTVDSSKSTSACNEHGICKWVVEIRGPEDRDIMLSCSKDYWSSENDFSSMARGLYSVRVSAISSTGVLRASQQDSIFLDGFDTFERITLSFSAKDFQ